MRALTILSQTAALLALAATVPVASANCYRVYAPDNSVVFRSLTPPVDLSQPLHMTMPVVAPGGRLVFAPDAYGCEVETNELDTLRKMSPAASAVQKRSIQQRRKTSRAGAA